MIKYKSDNLWEQIKPLFKEVGKYYKKLNNVDLKYIVDLEYKRGDKSKRNSLKSSKKSKKLKQQSNNNPNSIYEQLLIKRQ